MPELNINDIPAHCVDIFKSKFRRYPSVIFQPVNGFTNLVEKKLNKYHITWFYYGTDTEILAETNGDGVMIYYNSSKGIFALCIPDKMDSASNAIFDLNR
jgi:hypothetical protein